MQVDETASQSNTPQTERMKLKTQNNAQTGSKALVWYMVQPGYWNVHS